MIQWNSKNKSSSKNLCCCCKPGVDFCVKVDDDIHKDTTLEVQSKEPIKKVMMIFQEPILDAPMEASIQEPMIQGLAIQMSVIQESKMQAPTILM